MALAALPEISYDPSQPTDRWSELGSPRLRVVTGGAQADRRPSARVRRRRLFVAGTVALAGVVLLNTLKSPLQRRSPGLQGSLVEAATASGLPLSTKAAQGTFYVVHSGDTLASIATRIEPAHPAAVFAELVAKVGSDRVVAGEHIPLA